MAIASKIFGWTDEVTACDCCGKSDLSGTFGVELERGDLVHYGSTCVVRNLGFANRKGFNKAARRDQDTREKAARIRYRHTAEYAAEQVAFARAHEDVKAGKLQIGREFADRVGSAVDAAQARRKVIATEFGVQQHTL